MRLTDLSDSSLDKILQLERKKKKFTLSGIKRFVNAEGLDFSKLKIIHVAGTNGKGSVCSMIASSLSDAGYSVGLYTSPHLVKINERIRVSRKLISDKDLKRLSKKVFALEKKHNIPLSFFETLTVISLLYFIEKDVEFAVIETGMGGRLDATNIITPALSVITNVSLEHKEILGDTVEKIAAEKAGIVKPKVPVVTNAKGKALGVIKESCRRSGSDMLVPEKLKKIPLEFKQNYQKENAETASAALRYLGISEKHISSGLKGSAWPGRFHFIGSNLLLDAAHNPAGITALIRSLESLDYRKLFIIFDIMQDKDPGSMCKSLSKIDAGFILTRAAVSRALHPSSFQSFFPSPVITDNLEEALSYAYKKATKKDLILITGSIYLIGEFFSLKKP